MIAAVEKMMMAVSTKKYVPGIPSIKTAWMDRDRIVNVRTAAYANDMEIESFRFLMIEKIPILSTTISRTIKSDRIIFEPRVVMIVKTQGYHNIKKKSTQVG
jgi:hypothetical protein